MKKKDLLNEIAGVPKILDTWIDLFVKVVIDKIVNTISTGWDEVNEDGSAKNPETGELQQISVYKVSKKYDGKEIMEDLSGYSGFSDLKEFMKSDLFKGLPIWRPNIEIMAVGVPSWLFEKELSNGSFVNAAMVTKAGNQELGRIGKIPVITSVGFRFEPLLPDDVDVEGISDKLKYEIGQAIKPTIAHELLHTYQTFKQMESGNPSHFGREMLLNAMSQHPGMKFEMFGEWNRFLMLNYLHLSFEVNARVTQLYYEMEINDVKTKEDFLRVLKKSTIWKEVTALESFDAKQLLKDFKLPDFGDGIEQFIGSTMFDLELRMRGLVNTETKEDIIKSLINLWDVILQQGSEAMKEFYGVDIPMDKVPQSAKEDPYLFFKFFEKRFHKKAKKFKKKLYRIASLVLNKENEVKTEGKIYGLKEQEEDDFEWIKKIPGIRDLYQEMMEGIDNRAWDIANRWTETDESNTPILYRLVGFDEDGNEVNEINLEDGLRHINDLSPYSMNEWILFFKTVREEGI